METIKNYLDNMFAGLPKTARITELKNNILSNMEDKYNELKNQGKSENEAIGIVISEFGNIDELMNELGIQKETEINSQPLVTAEEVDEYLNAKKKMGLMVGFGVFLCILGPAMLILLHTLFENGIITSNLTGDAAEIPGVIILLVLVTIAVGIFIFSGMKFERYKYIEEGVQLPLSTEADLKIRYERFRPTFSLMLITGVCLIILSPIAIFVANTMGETSSVYGVVILLLIVATSVFMFINMGMVKESYERLLNVGDYNIKYRTKSEKEDKVIGAVASIVWPLAVAIFLFCGFVYNLWHIAWVVFPITGILFGMFSAAYSIITDKKY
jgi:hypothetical protein